MFYHMRNKNDYADDEEEKKHAHVSILNFILTDGGKNQEWKVPWSIAKTLVLTF